MEKRIASLLLVNLLLTFSMVGFVLVVFDLIGIAFTLELLALIGFICAFSFGMYSAYHGKRFGWVLITTALLGLVMDVLFVSAFSATLGMIHAFTLFFSAAALIVALAGLKGEHPAEEKADDKGSYYSRSSNAEAQKEEPVKKTFEPGKYVASKKANKYHTAKCDWALRISKENRIWFNTKEDAELKGYVRDKCV